ncbi:hypothetical protein SAMN05444413_11555 [Roseivivax marinus]|uniref:hypothetical protein n=1 Tax=Roseivivax marinus TaxID=1379903 RepID=UPI0008BE4F13|nr:hypothetical protein [Roseivivax marinus]SEL75305.1 hypothetical protein SAMN05444413_11555 [Roseivivax marinus]
MSTARRSTRPPAATRSARRPRLLIAGEFSAGKTRLINGLLGGAVLPSNVTATHLPPVWLVGGGSARMAVDLSGEARAIEALDGIDVAATHHCVLSHHADCLARLDLIDTPGSSDPNMTAESWERMLPLADAVVWCTNATQAWRQSEKAVWQDMPEALRANATLLVTHADRLPDRRAADRVLRRVQREAGPFFAHILLASLIEPEDLARIGDHLGRLAEGLDALPGRADKLTAELAAQPVARPHGSEAAPVAPPRRVAPAETARPTRPMRPGRSNVVRLPLAPSGDRPADLRALWSAMIEDIDRTDATAVLACVERLIDSLETGERLPGATARPEPTATEPRPVTAAREEE